QTLKLMRKGTTAFQNLKFLMHCLAHGIQPLWNLLVGFPREPEAVYRKYHDDIPLLLHLPPPAGAFPVRFDRFSPYHKQAAEYGLELRACDFYGMVYPFPAAELDSLAYFFRDGSFSAAYQVATARWLGKLQRRVADWQSRWQGSGGAGRPELAARQSADGSWSIRDSRGASLRQHRLDAQGWRLLSLLGEQRKLASLAERCSGMEPTEIEQRLAQLRERGLLFEEDGVYLSLVSPARPAAQMNSSRVCNASKELATT
ncbi:MAG TPA: hypothetical protein VMW75_03710, partial [Thermoanaerobaculia bacterium]|nr:hypothetical protein [Thermoanaerobaculia bacterium]